MQDDSLPPLPLSLNLLPYHAALRDFLKQVDGDIWKWFAERRLSPKYGEDVRFELLKSTYRIERDSQLSLYENAETVAKQLGITAPITIYQAQNPFGLNASLAYVPGEVHIVLHGPIAAQLAPAELSAVLAHELGHYRLCEDADGELLVASEMLQALCNDSHAHPSHFASLRLFRLYAEIFCDRAALAVTNDLATAVSSLVKVQTGVTEIDPAAYLRQADEIFTRECANTDGITHPEAFIRARAVRLWHEQHPDAENLISQMIEGNPALDELDLLGQFHSGQETRRLMDALLWRKWFQSDVVLAHARLYFDDYSPPNKAVELAGLLAEGRKLPDSVRDYWCFVLLDFVTADREMEEPPLAAALLLTEQIGIKPRFVELLRQELKLRKNVLERIDKNKEQILAEADRAVVAAP
jgi:hypothetical protein